MALYKRSTNTIRLLQEINKSRAEGIQDFSGSNNSGVVPLVFGSPLYQPTLLYKTERSIPYDNNPTPGKFVSDLRTVEIYALSFNESPLSPNNFQQFHYIAGGLWINGHNVRGMQTASDVTMSVVRNNRNWQVGQGIGISIGENFGDYTVMAQVIKADTYSLIAPNTLLDAYGLEEYASDTMDLLVVAYNPERKPWYFEGGSTTLHVNYHRRPLVNDPTDADEWTQKKENAGNCLLELMQNPTYGLGIDNAEIDINSFLNVGGLLDAVFDTKTNSLVEVINTICTEDQKTIDKINGLYTLVDMKSTTVNYVVTADTILDDIEVIFTDKSALPSKFIGTYVSRTSGERQLVITGGGDNVMQIEIKTRGRLSSAQTVMQDLYNKVIANQYSFLMDKAAAQFKIGDVISVSTDIPKLTGEVIRVIGIELQDDFTYRIQGEQVIPSDTPVIFSGAIPLLDSGGLYRPSREEPDDIDRDDPIVPPEPLPTPNPGEIEPAPDIYRTYAGLQHPYNFVTGADNTDWYLGALTDESTVDSKFDANGCHTFWTDNFPVVKSNTFLWRTRFSLIWRNLSKTAPLYVFAIYDLAKNTSELNNNWLGYSNWSNRADYDFHFQGSFSNPDYIRFRDASDPNWRELGTPIRWKDWRPYRRIYPGDTDPNSSVIVPDFCYTWEEYGEKAYGRSVHTFDSRQEATPLLNGQYIWQSLDSRKSSAYRVHFFAAFGRDERTEYIGSSSFWGDHRGVQPADEDTAEQGYNQAGGVWISGVYQSPPNRSIT